MGEERYEVKITENQWRSPGEGHLLRIIVDGEEIESYPDRGEPEDNCFYRDWSWIDDELRRAYELGRQHEKEEGEAARRGL